MARQLTLEQCDKIDAWRVFQSLIAVQREFEKLCGAHIATTRGTIYVINSKFLETGFVLDKRCSGVGVSATTTTGAEVLAKSWKVHSDRH